MSVPQENQVQENAQTNKELNFRLQEQTLKAKYEKELALERSARMEAEKKVQESLSRKQQDDEDEPRDPYVDHQKLKKTISNLEEQNKQHTLSQMQKTKDLVKEEIRQEMWLESRPDFYDTLKHADQLALKARSLARAILSMPDSFERQQLVYENIKQLGLDQPEKKAPSIQETIDSKKRSPYYQPSGVGSAPYASAGDFSTGGQKNAYDKMQELKNRLRL